MTITIPMWVIWILGGVLGLGVLALCVFGVIFIWCFKDYMPYRM